MSETHASTGKRYEAGRYDIRIKGHLDTRWAAWFDGLSLTHESDGTTLIHGQVGDQAALHGLLQKVRDTGLRSPESQPGDHLRPVVPQGPNRRRSRSRRKRRMSISMNDVNALITAPRRVHGRRLTRSVDLHPRSSA